MHKHQQYEWSTKNITEKTCHKKNISSMMDLLVLSSNLLTKLHLLLMVCWQKYEIWLH